MIFSVQTGYIVRGGAQKIHFSGDFLLGFDLSQVRLFSWTFSTGPFQFREPLIFTNAPRKSTCL